MNLKSLDLKKAYSSDFDNSLRDFYIPALEASIEYNRLAGFFSSTSLAIAARGVLGLIRNGGTMRLIASPQLSKRDLEIILDSEERREEYISKRMLEDLARLEDEFVKDHVFALGWMVANRKLEIRIAVPYDEEGKLLSYEEVQQRGVFHQKVGILKDSEGNLITFSGSVNETAKAWLDNIEEFKVFRDWEPSEEDYVGADVSKFNKFWNDQSPRVRIMDVPKAVERKLIEIAPANVDKIDLERWCKTQKRKPQLFQHQQAAIEAWLKNGMRGLFEMATGTGKTFAALGCLDKASKTTQKLIVVIACPYHHLIEQWIKEIEKFGVETDKLIVADATNQYWRNELADSLMDISLGHKTKVMAMTTHRTFSSPAFRKIIQSNKQDSTALLIADEVHGIGAEKSQEGLIDEYDLRLGLSATPRRWFDSPGTELIYDYFGGVVYEFGLKKAINTLNPDTDQAYLTPYRYRSRFVSLTEEELEEYHEKTRRIVMNLNKTETEEQAKAILDILMFQRANIVKNALGKYQVLEEILDELRESIRWTLIYCSPEQIDEVMEIVNRRGIAAHRFTMEEGTSPEKKYGWISEREHLLEEFAEGKYKILVAMKCLDEGVDVPPARIAILMASSGNPREYIQRIGRVIRRYPGKSEALIYDVVTSPSLSNLPSELKEMEKKIFEKELKRYEEIAKIALNRAEALTLICDIKEKL